MNTTFAESWADDTGLLKPFLLLKFIVQTSDAYLLRAGHLFTN